jgi:hypothetical protein
MSTRTLMSQIVHVVPILDVPMMWGSSSFQSKLVSGAQASFGSFFCSSKRIRRQSQVLYSPLAIRGSQPP